MADIILKVGDTPTYQDGDIICAFTDRHISCCHAQNICGPRHLGFKSNGLRDANSLTYRMFSEFYQYRFDRLSLNEVRRTNLWDGTQEIFSNKTEKQIYVEEFLQRRVKHGRHLIFGSPSREIWFGGRSDFSQGKVDRLWTHITEKTGKQKEKHDLWPCGKRDVIDHFVLKLDRDVSDEEVRSLTESVTGQVEVEGKVGETIVKKRKKFIAWQDLPVISPPTIGHINDVSTPVDGRRKSEIGLNIVEVKP